jgi:hypothetical protein
MIRGIGGLVNRSTRPTASAAIAVVTVWLLAPNAAGAQGTAPPPTPLKTYDLTAYIGNYNTGDERQQDPFYGYYERRLNRALGSAGFGFYWTEHVKTEVELGTTNTAETSGYRLVDVPGFPGARAYTREEVRATVLTVAQSYQFFHNAWFHPFLTAGVDVGWERTRSEQPSQPYYPPIIFTPGPVTPTPPRPVQLPAGPTQDSSEVTARAFGGGGFKAYFTRSAFFRADFRVGGGGDGSSKHARIGFGFDF